MPIVTLAGPGSRYHTAGSSSAAYSDIDALTPDFIVDPARTTNGSGTEASPYQPSQAFGLNPNGQRVVFEWLPGNLDFTDADPNSKFSRWHPLHSGTVSNPIIHRCRYKASRATTTAQQLTSIRRTGGAGGILGILNTNYCWFDGFNLPTWIGSHDGNENYHFSLWGSGCTGIRFVRFKIDGQGIGNSTKDSTNSGGIWAQPSTGFEVADGFIANIGQLGTQYDIWSGVEVYDTQGLHVHHLTIDSVHGFGVFLKGDPNREFIQCRIHHVLTRNCTGSAYFAYQVEADPPLSNMNWWYQLIALNCGRGVELNRAGDPEINIGPHRGTLFQNFTFVGCNEGIAIRPGDPGDGGDAYAPLIRFRNGVFYQNATNIGVVDQFWDAIGIDSIEFDYNRYNGETTRHFNDANGDRNFAEWQDLQGNGVDQDQHGDTDVPTFVNAGANDYRTAQGAPQDGSDYLGVLGNDLRRGAFGEVGCRTYA